VYKFEVILTAEKKMHSVGSVLFAVVVGSIVAAAKDQPVPPVYVATENEDQGEPEQPAVHCEGQIAFRRKTTRYRSARARIALRPR